MDLAREKLIDGLVGFPKSFSDELIQLKTELFDNNGNPIFPKNGADIKVLSEKTDRYFDLLKERKAYWLAGSKQ